MVNEIPIAPLKRIIKDAGAERVSDNAAIFLRNLLQQNAESIAEKAVIMANVAGRKTVNDSDLKHALEYFKWT